MDEEIAEILIHMRVADPSPGSMSTDGQIQQDPQRKTAGVPATIANNNSSGKRYGTRTAGGLKVGRRYTDLLND